MWPKALLELLPHLTRLVPLANRFFQSKAESDNALRSAIERKLDASAAALRVDLEKTGEANERLSQQLNKQTATLAEVAAELKTVQSQLEILDQRTARLEKRSGNLSVVVVLAVVQSLVLCVLLVIALYQLHTGSHHV
jgi:septal ring factor EnvC (AmiA/AmiB activator)